MTENTNPLPAPIKHTYGPHALQYALAWPVAGTSNASKDESFWIVYVHGGAWRDPTISAGPSFTPCISCLLSSSLFSPPTTTNHISPISGVASLNYRLSPHPSFPQPIPPATCPSEYRNAKHPAHINDVVAGLRALQRAYGFDGRYILVGHSCGATLAMQVLMGLGRRHEGNSTSEPELGSRPGKGVGKGDYDVVEGDEDEDEAREEIALPAAVVGIEGIYDFRGLVSRMGPGYDAIFRVPFGEDERKWDDASPALFQGWQDMKEKVSGRIILAWSKEDELVDEGEVVAMRSALEKAGVRCECRLDLTENHDQIWKDGSQVAKLCVDVLDKCKRLE